ILLSHRSYGRGSCPDRGAMAPAGVTATFHEHAPCRSAQAFIAAGDDPLCFLWTKKFGKRSEEHTSELQSLMRISYAVFCLKKKTNSNQQKQQRQDQIEQ